MTRTVVRMVALLMGQGPQTDLLLRQIPVRFPLLSSRAPGAFQLARNEYEIEPQEGHGAHARIRTGDLFLTKEMLCHLSYVGEPQPKDTSGPRIIAARSPDANDRRRAAGSGQATARSGRTGAGRARAGRGCPAGRHPAIGD